MILHCFETVASWTCWVFSPLWHLLAHWKSSIIWIVEQFAFEVLFLLRRPGTQCKSQEVICPPCFNILLVQQIQQKILVPLNKSLRVDLTMFQLFVTVSLDSLQKGSECLLLFSPELRLLLVNHSLNNLSLIFPFVLLLKIALDI